MVSSCNSTIAAIKTDGSLWMWGYNSQGQIGDNSTTHKSSPVQTIAGGTNWKQVTVARNNAAAIKTDGTLWAWGLDNYGQLGDNSTAHKSSPVQTVAGGNNWKQIAGGRAHLSAIRTDGTLWGWGRDQYGQLGNNLLLAVSSPIQTIAGGSNWKYVACSYNHTVAIRDFDETF